MYIILTYIVPLIIFIPNNSTGYVLYKIVKVHR